MRARFERILERYGQTVVLTRRESGRETALRAFLQPLLQRREHPPVAATPLGAADRRRWLYIGPGGVPLSPGDRIAWEGRTLRVQEAVPVYWRDEPLYCRAILAPGKEMAE